MYNQEGDPSEPEWVKTEREQFTEFRDKNSDGRMDKDETRDWILPSDYDHADAEAKHLVYESDADKVRSPTSGDPCAPRKRQSFMLMDRLGRYDGITVYQGI